MRSVNPNLRPRAHCVAGTKLFSTVSFLLFVLFQTALPQDQRDRSTFDMFERDQDRTQRTTTPSTLPFPNIALESTIDPDKYYVGPSDVFSINIWTGAPLSFALAVTPEGTLIVPTVGELRVAGLLLSEAKKKILFEIARKYVTGNATATLIQPRPIVVTVTGNVLNPGLYTLTAVDRTDKAIEEANRPTRLQNQNEITRVLRDMSTRNILLKHRDNTTDKVDIAKFLAVKEDKWNPYLREGDVVIVPRKNFQKNAIGVYGELNVPGRYEFVRGDSLKDAIRLAQGFTRLAIRDSIEFSRLDLTGETKSSQTIDARALFDGKLSDVALEPGDRIVVRGQPDLREDYRATIDGEVLYPGTYPLTKNRTRLTELIRAAGGVTGFADLKSAELNRRSVGFGEIELERLLSSRGGVTADDSLYYQAETELRLRKEIVNVDFVKLLMQNDSTEDVILQSEDYVFVPSIKKTIYVFGQVVSPGHIPFVPREDARYYIEKAGGMTDDARSGDLKIIKARTKQWLSENETALEQGDYIWIPKKIDRPFIYYTTIVSHFATILSAIVGIAIVVATVAK